MEPSASSSPSPSVNRQSRQSSQEKCTESKSLHSHKVGSHRVKQTDPPAKTTMETNTDFSPDKAKPLGDRQGYHCDATRPTYNQLQHNTKAGTGNNQQTTVEYFENEFMSLAGLEPSIHQRRYPMVGHTTQFISRSPNTDEKFAKLHQQLRQHFKEELSCREFSNYLKEKKIPENYNDFTLSKAIKFEVDVHYIFRHHPTFQYLSFNNTRPYILLFADADIRHMYNFIPERTLYTKGIEIFYSQNNRPIIQQRNAHPENSAAAVAAMLAHERGKTVDKGRLCSVSALNTAKMEHELRFYGLDCCETDVRKPPSLFQLSQAIQSNGSVAVLLKYKDEHFIWVLVDDINTESGNVRCRNPYNCEELDVKQQAFCDKWFPEEGFVQLKA